MPANKDLKRLIRARMQKTGESYTTARAQLLKRSPSRPARPADPVPADYARLAGMSDAAVKAKTGCAWDQWVVVLDKLGAAHLPHREIARLVHEQYELDGWWTQTVTVGYERIRGLREKGQRRGGLYEANKSKTLPVPIERLYRAFAEARARKRWLAGTAITVRTKTTDKSIRFAWPDGTLVMANFTSKGDGKSQVAVQHTGLPAKADAERMKAFWGERLGVLGEVLGTR